MRNGRKEGNRNYFHVSPHHLNKEINEEHHAHGRKNKGNGSWLSKVKDFLGMLGRDIIDDQSTLRKGISSAAKAVETVAPFIAPFLMGK